MVMLIGPGSLFPVPFLGGGGQFSHQVLHHASIAHAERLMEHRRGCERYHDAVTYTAWKLQKRIKQDLGYKIWAVYNDVTTAYVTYWKLAYFFATLSRVLEACSAA
ncbi:hypothetical protein HYH03_015552 [Edaphochlamys debaryana]|uniref:Uncharacterized protein n=1 Tax=Edaphochlamys debaryana TaxID=47281 RepID=A0A836BSG7_9CHLO|nr:hypothetical protein HYH03_015552 [Edaphochlamys debaryana]|eukprot:KAG2485743.1 hypothetical protein HYH03_015552 [Edaphochlamys debaryana]